MALNTTLLWAALAIVSATACRPRVSTRVASLSDSTPEGLFAATDIREVPGSQPILYEVSCLNSNETKTFRNEEILQNKICPKLAPSDSQASNGAQTTAPTGPTSSGSMLVFGDASWLKSDAIDCAAVSCTAGPTACPVGRSGPQNVPVTSIFRSDKRAYDHVIADVSGVPGCSIKRAYIFFPHLDVSVKFTGATQIGAQCSMKPGTVLMGRIEKFSTPAKINFRITKSNDCASSGAVVNFSVDVIEKSEIVRAIFGL